MLRISSSRALRLVLPLLAITVVGCLAWLALPARADDPDIQLSPENRASPDLEVNSDGSFTALVYYEPASLRGPVYLKSAEATKGWRTRPNPLGFTAESPKLAFSKVNTSVVYALWIEINGAINSIQYAECTLSATASPACNAPGLVYSSTTILVTPDIVVDNSDRLHLAWADSGTGQIQTVVINSLQNLPVTTPVAVTPSSGDVFVKPVLATSGSFVHLGFFNDADDGTLGNPREAIYYRSDAASHSWSNSHTFAIQVGGISTNLEEFGNLALFATGSDVLLVWDAYDEQAGGFGLMAAGSSDSGSSWDNSEYVPSGANTNSFPGNEVKSSSSGTAPPEEYGLRPSITISGTNFALAWQQRPNSSCTQTLNGSSEIYYAEKVSDTWVEGGMKTADTKTEYAIASDIAIPSTKILHLAYMKDTGISSCIGGLAEDYAIYYQGPFTIIANDEGESCCVFLPVIFKN